jgi:hypothetical protein
MNIFINGSAASQTGALSILNKFFSSESICRDNNYFVASPFKPIYCPENVTWIRCSTNGIMSYFFAVFFSYYYIIKFGCTKSISFSNVNVFFPVKEKVTYFHQALIFTNKKLKFKILRFTIKYLNRKNNLFVVQTNYIYSCFVNVFGKDHNLTIKWPGLSESLKDVCVFDINDNFNYIVIPITSLQDSNKNFEFILDVISFCNNKIDLKFYICSDGNESLKRDFENLKFLGKLEQSEFYSLINNSVGVLVTSLEETLCLPIFESIALNKNVFVYERPYVSGVLSVLKNYEINENRVSLFSSKEDFLSVFESNSLKQGKSDICPDFLTGQWDF